MGTQIVADTAALRDIGRVLADAGRMLPHAHPTAVPVGDPEADAALRAVTATWTAQLAVLRDEAERLGLRAALTAVAFRAAGG